MRDDHIWHYISDDEDEYPEEEPFHYEDKYLYDYQWYHEKFPVIWAVNHKEGTGPGQCSNCADYGSVNGVFIGYCANCALYEYEGTRGRGFIDVGVEISDNNASKSAFETYLSGVNVNEILPIPGLTKENNNLARVPSFESDYEEPEDEYDDPTSVLNAHFEGGYNDW